MSRVAVVSLAGAPRVNLLPASERARREHDRLGRVWIWAALGAVVIAALLVGGAWVWNTFAQQELAAEQLRTQELVGEIAGLSEVSGAIATEKELTGYLAEAMGSDLAWSDVRSKIESALPADVALVGFSLVPGMPAVDKLTEETVVGTAGLTGTITLDSPNTIDIAAISRQLRTVGAVAQSDSNAIAESGSEEGRFTYTIDITFDQGIYSGRFAAEQEGGQ
ncbi:PilN domain-containing protein [Microbacterium sp. KHB019]|uniref:PilN domain-containing protein n=1 Tax=Microbacterium sp. KHB019 TaxID=3129770 RepID=UPI003078FD57